MDDGPRASARAVIIATGAAYRKPDIANLSRFEGAGVYYGATPMEAQLCVNEEVVVVGGVLAIFVYPRLKGSGEPVPKKEEPAIAPGTTPKATPQKDTTPKAATPPRQ